MKTRITIATKALRLASVIVFTTPLLIASAQSRRVVQMPLPTPTPTQQVNSRKQVDAKSDVVADGRGDTYKLVFPISYDGIFRKGKVYYGFGEYDRARPSINKSFVEQLNRAGEEGYRIISTIGGPVGIVKFDEARYEYAWFETYSEWFFAKTGFEEKYSEFSKQGFRLVDHLLLSYNCEPMFPGDRSLEIPDIGEKCISKDLFLLEREKGINEPTQHLLVSSVPSWRGHPSAEMSTQNNANFAEGFYASKILSKFEILLEQTEKNDELLTDGPDVQLVRSSLGLRDDAIVKKRVNELANQGYRLALVNNEIALMYRRSDSVTPVSYIWLDTKKKDFEKRLVKLQESGAIYRMTYPNRQGDKNKLIFEQKAGDDSSRREYRVLKFDFQDTEDASEKKVHTDLTPSSKETMKMLNSLAKRGFIVRDLFVSDKVSVLLERSQFASMSLHSVMVGQESNLPPELNQTSSLSEILAWLDKNSFPQARIGLKSKGPESYLRHTDPIESIELLNSPLSEELIFSQGFKVANAAGCNLTLRNDEVKIIDWWTKSYDVHLMSFAKFLFDGKKGERKLTPHSALLSIPLDRMSYRKGKAPYRQTKNPEKAKLLGTWRTKFTDKGFFEHSVFLIEITASEQKDIKEHTYADTLTFTFDDKETSERFNAAFRQAIKLCTAK